MTTKTKAKTKSKPKSPAKTTPEQQPQDATHARVVAALADVPDAKLTAAAKKFPIHGVDGGAKEPPAKRFAINARAKLAGAKTDENRAAALWTLARTRPSAALPIAYAILDAPTRDEHARSIALGICARAPTELGSLDRVLAAFLCADASWSELFAAKDALAVLDHPELVVRLAALLATLAATPDTGASADMGITPGAELARAIGRRKLVELAVPLARYATSAADDTSRSAAAEQLLGWWRADPTPATLREALAILADAADDEDLVMEAAAARVAIAPDRALAEATALAPALDLPKPKQFWLQHVVAAACALPLDERVRWIEVGLALLDHATRPDPFLAYAALDLFAKLPRDPRIVAALERALADNRLGTHQVRAALAAQTADRAR